MAEQRKRLSKEASKILFEIICEDSFEGQKIKTALPATRRISKTRESMWEFIRTELRNRSGQDYDLCTLSAAWYYNLRKIGSCLDQIDMSSANPGMLARMRTMERYLCSNLGDRYRRNESPIDDDELEDTRIPLNQMLSMSRQSTMDSGAIINPNGITAQVQKVVTLNNSIVVKNERGSSNEEREKEGSGRVVEEDEENGEEEIDENEMIDNPMDNTSLNDAHPVQITSTGGNTGPKDLESLRVPPPPSRYHSAQSSQLSRNNSTSSFSGYDADNEKGLIKRRRKEIKLRGERNGNVKAEEMGGENEEEHREEEEEEQRENVEMEEREEDNSEKEKMMDNLKGMIENLRDHIISLASMGVIHGSDMEILANSFSLAGSSLRSQMETA